jgi:hypothetical protein
MCCEVEEKTEENAGATANLRRSLSPVPAVTCGRLQASLFYGKGRKLAYFEDIYL